MDVMIVIDEKNGMMFNHRRQSRDKALCEKMINYAADRNIWMDPYSAKLFPEDCVVADVDFLQKGDLCFVETCDITPYLDKIEKLILFNWNRVYPADQFFTVDLNNQEWNIIKKEEFKGNSHDKITMEVYRHEKLDKSR